MALSSERAAHPERGSRLRELPSVDELLGRARIASRIGTAGHGLAAQAARSVLADARARLKDSTEATPPALELLEERTLAEIEALLAPSLRPVINATGVVLHTNLGRAPLSAAALARIAETAGRYANLEYDIASGTRGRRDAHTSRLLAEVAGTESAIVVNNNAAAVFLALHTLAKGAEVIVSRGELVEIGDGFRIPDILAESGATLREVGTTNRTRLRDYERAINDRTRLLLRVHPSNFRITGFTERPSLEELAALGERAGLPVFEDLGSGCLADLSASAVAEPLVRQSSRAGIALISFSGDKLLGGPQAGILAGKKALIEPIRANPLFRALRVDKLTIAALEATLQSYRRGALEEIPALAMIQLPPEEIARRARRFLEHLRPALPSDARVEVSAGFSVIGGGSTPDKQLPTHLILLASARHSAAALEERLRKPAHGAPVIARIAGDRLALDFRTVSAAEEEALDAALAAALR